MLQCLSFDSDCKFFRDKLKFRLFILNSQKIMNAVSIVKGLHIKNFMYCKKKKVNHACLTGIIINFPINLGVFVSSV